MHDRKLYVVTWTKKLPYQIWQKKNATPLVAKETATPLMAQKPPSHTWQKKNCHAINVKRNFHAIHGRKNCRAIHGIKTFTPYTAKKRTSRCGRETVIDTCQKNRHRCLAKTLTWIHERALTSIPSRKHIFAGRAASPIGITLHSV